MHYQNGQGECTAWPQQEPVQGWLVQGSLGKSRQGPETKASHYRDYPHLPADRP